MKTAIVHDWLVVYGGAERVLEQMLTVYPRADLFSLIDFLPEKERTFLQGKQVKTSFLQRMPLAAKKYRSYLQLMPLAIEQFDLSDYDLVISSSSAVAKGVITGPGQVHICMCYTPVRYAWDLQHQYLEETGLKKGLMSWYARKVLHDLRIWDYRSAAGVDHFIAISKYIRKRIWKYYRREAEVIYPPVDTGYFTPGQEEGNYYLTVSRLVPYKRVDLIVEAFNQMPDKRLVVIGDGPEMKKLAPRAGKNVSMLGYQTQESVLRYMQAAKAFVYAANEDFGIVLLEAQACGTPVIAYGKGGALETVQGLGSRQATGLFFYEQSANSLVEAVKSFENAEDIYSVKNCRENAMRFGEARFRNELETFIEEKCAQMISDDYNYQGV